MAAYFATEFSGQLVYLGTSPYASISVFYLKCAESAVYIWWTVCLYWDCIEANITETSICSMYIMHDAVYQTLNTYSSLLW